MMTMLSVKSFFQFSPRRLARSLLPLLVFVVGAPLVRAELDTLRQAFVHPPASAKPGCYWWWLDGRVNKFAITRDLEEFAAKGIGEVLLVNSANLRPSDDGVAGVKFLSPEW